MKIAKILFPEGTGRMIKAIAGILCILLLPTFTIWAADDVTVTLRLDRVEATLSDTVRMEIRVSGSRKSDAPPVLQGLESFLVTKGGTSSRVEIINGKVNSGVDYTYFIQPQKIGQFEIGPIKVSVDGKTYERVRANPWWSEQHHNQAVQIAVRFSSRRLSHHRIFLWMSKFFTP